jgi:hypothetical protein
MPYIAFANLLVQSNPLPFTPVIDSLNVLRGTFYYDFSDFDDKNPNIPTPTRILACEVAYRQLYIASSGSSGVWKIGCGVQAEVCSNASGAQTNIKVSYQLQMTASSSPPVVPVSVAIWPFSINLMAICE